MYIPRKCKGLLAYCLIIIFSAFISGCLSLPDPEVSQGNFSDVVGSVYPTQTLSQTIEGRRNGFNGITLWLGIDPEASVTDSQAHPSVYLELYKHSEPEILIHQSTIQLAKVTESQAISISFPPQNESSGQKYIIYLSTDAGSIKVFGRNEDIYPLGQILINSIPQEADLAFSTTYNYDFRALLDDINIWLKYAYLIPSFIIVLFLPGWVLIRITELIPNRDLSQMLVVSLGVSLAITPVVLMWTSAIGITWTRTALLVFNGLLVSIWMYFSLRRNNFRHILSGVNNWRIRILSKISITAPQFAWRLSASTLSLLTLLCILFISLVVRLIMVRDFATPAWVDSIHHALITRIILDTGALPTTYSPYLNLEPTLYHPGFHSQLASFQSLTNLDIASGMLIFGQVLNALFVISIYTLTRSITHSNLASNLAALITGVFTPMPAYYTSWGRYTQLSGLIVLISAYLLFKRVIYAKSSSNNIVSLLLLAGFTAGGMLLIHYRVSIFFILLIFSELLIFLGFPQVDNIPKKQLFSRLAVYTLFPIILLIPWLIDAIPNTIMPSLTRPVPDETRWFADFSWRYLTAASGKQTLVIAGLGLLWGLIQKKRFAYQLLIWVGMLLLIGNSKLLGIPGGGLLNTTSVEISLFIPISIFCGYFVSEMVKHWKIFLPKKLHFPFRLSILVTTVIITIIAVKNIIPILNPITILSRKADISAINWIEENIKEDETFLINPFLWGYGLYAGSDGGSWITPLAGNPTIPPPVIYGFTPKDEREHINQICQFTIENGHNAMAMYNYLKDEEIHYIYIGARGGPIYPHTLVNHPGFKSIYQDQGTWIIEVLP